MNYFVLLLFLWNDILNFWSSHSDLSFCVKSNLTSDAAYIDF